MSQGPTLNLSWQLERFEQRSACADHVYPHRAVAVHLDGLPCASAERLQSVRLCVDGFCQSTQRDGNRWAYPRLFGEAVHHEQFRVFHDGNICEASVLFYPPDTLGSTAVPADLTWTSLPEASSGTGPLDPSAHPEQGVLHATLPALQPRQALGVRVWQEPEHAQLCAQAQPYTGPGSAQLVLQTKPPGIDALYHEQETPIGSGGGQACMPLQGSHYAAAFAVIHEQGMSVENKLEIDNQDVPVFACGSGSQRP